MSDMFARASAKGCTYDAIRAAAEAETEKMMQDIEASRREAEEKRREAERKAARAAERARNAEEKTFICPSCECPFTLTRGWFNNKEEHITGFVFEKVWKEHKCPHCGSIVQLDAGTRFSRVGFEIVAKDVLKVIGAVAAAAAVVLFFIWHGKSVPRQLEYCGRAQAKCSLSNTGVVLAYGFINEDRTEIYWCRDISGRITKCPEEGTVMSATQYPHHAIWQIKADGYYFEILETETLDKRLYPDPQ